MRREVKNNLAKKKKKTQRIDAFRRNDYARIPIEKNFTTTVFVPWYF